MVKIKICGITNLEDALAAVEYGADALGFVFFPGSPRYIRPAAAKEIIAGLPPLVCTVGVFVNDKAEQIREILNTTGLSVVQLHGDEPPEQCRLWPRVIKALRVRHFVDLMPLENYGGVSALLLDTYTMDTFGGSGQIFNWEIAIEAKRFGKIILAGGLNPDNIEAAIRRVQPYGVDVSSGVEKDKGNKDHKKLKEFIERARAA